MTAYTIKMFREARRLNPAPAVKEIISKLARHFNEEIRSTILGRPISTLEDLLELLERFDNTGPLNIHRIENPHVRDNWRNNGSVNQQPQPRFSTDRPNQHRKYTEAQNKEGKEENWRKSTRGQELTRNNVRVLDVVSCEDDAVEDKTILSEN